METALVVELFSVSFTVLVVEQQEIIENVNRSARLFRSVMRLIFSGFSEVKYKYCAA
jgi:hypothetical protein